MILIKTQLALDILKHILEPFQVETFYNPTYGYQSSKIKEVLMVPVSLGEDYEITFEILYDKNMGLYLTNYESFSSENPFDIKEIRRDMKMRKIFLKFVRDFKSDLSGAFLLDLDDLPKKEFSIFWQTLEAQSPFLSRGSHLDNHMLWCGYKNASTFQKDAVESAMKQAQVFCGDNFEDFAKEYEIPLPEDFDASKISYNGLSIEGYLNQGEDLMLNLTGFYHWDSKHFSVKIRVPLDKNGELTAPLSLKFFASSVFR
jgi:hypothetical protein